MSTKLKSRKEKLFNTFISDALEDAVLTVLLVW